MTTLFFFLFNGLGITIAWLFSTSLWFDSRMIYEQYTFLVFSCLVLINFVSCGVYCSVVDHQKRDSGDLIILSPVISLLAFLSLGILTSEANIFVFILCLGLVLGLVFHFFALFSKTYINALPPK